MGLLKEFKDFAMRGNVVDMAVGIVIGAAFGKIVSSLVKDVIMPPIGLLMGGVDFTKWSTKIGSQTKDVVKDDGTTVKETVDLLINQGAFIQTVVDFVIVAAAIFLVIKLMNTAKARFEKQQAVAPVEPSAEVKLLTEIRDSLKK